MIKEYARFRKYFQNINGYMYESVREDGRVYWKIMYNGCKFFCTRWKSEIEFINWAQAYHHPAEKICCIMRQSGWTQIKGPKSVTESSLKRNDNANVALKAVDRQAAF